MSDKFNAGPNLFVKVKDAEDYADTCCRIQDWRRKYSNLKSLKIYMFPTR